MRDRSKRQASSINSTCTLYLFFILISLLLITKIVGLVTVDRIGNKEMKFPPALATSGATTILSYGALLSEPSARLTFPTLANFRLARVKHLRRVFAHPHTFLISQNIVDPSDPSLKIGSLSAEIVTDESKNEVGFTVAAFEVYLNDEQRAAYLSRENEYDIVTWPFYEMKDGQNPTDATEPSGRGIICLASTDDKLPPEVASYRQRLKSLGMSIWHWSHSSGLLPADIYLRHCLLAVKKAGSEAMRSFREETYLADRKTTIAEYLTMENNEAIVMNSLPPEALMTRFNG